MKRAGLLLVRIGLPAAIAAENEQGAGVALIGCAVMVLLLNVFLRIGVADQRDRDREDAAREHFGRTGRWPDDKG